MAGAVRASDGCSTSSAWQAKNPEKGAWSPCNRLITASVNPGPNISELSLQGESSSQREQVSEPQQLASIVAVNRVADQPKAFGSGEEEVKDPLVDTRSVSALKHD